MVVKLKESELLCCLKARLQSLPVRDRDLVRLPPFFSRRRVSVVVVDINPEAAEAVVKEIESRGGRALAIAADVSVSDEVKGFVEKAVETYGRLDILFNNAGIYNPGNVEETSLEDWERSYAVNVRSVFLGMKYAMPHLKETKGNVVSTASAGGLIGFPGAVSYASSKGAVISLTRAAAVDYA